MPGPAPVVSEYLFFFPAICTDAGCVPSFYCRETSEEGRRAALKAGGIDVTDDEHSWRAYEREVRSYAAALL